MAEVVREAGRVDDVGVTAQGGAELATDLGDLERVGQPVAHEVVVTGSRTWVLAASRRRAEECTTRALSRAKSSRSARFWAGSSASHRSRSRPS